MHDAHMTPPAQQAGRNKLSQLEDRLIAVQAMQVDFSLAAPAATTQITQQMTRLSGPQPGKLILPIEAHIE